MEPIIYSRSGSYRKFIVMLEMKLVNLLVLRSGNGSRREAQFSRFGASIHEEGHDLVVHGGLNQYEKKVNAHTETERIKPLQSSSAVVREYM